LGSVFESAAGAIGVVSAFSLFGQAVASAGRMLQSRTNASVSKRPNPSRARVLSFAGGAASAIFAIISLMPGGASAGPSATAPRNAILVSSSGALSNGPLYILDVTSGSYRKLAAQGGRAWWSPNGARMAFTRSNPTELWVARADGSAAQRVAGMPSNGAITHVTWSGDSARIFFAYSQGFLAGGLQSIPVAGESPEQVLPISEGVDFPEVSPDGRTLAYFRGVDTTNVKQPPKQLKVLDLATKQARSLAADPIGQWNVTGLAWTNDGHALV